MSDSGLYVAYDLWMRIALHRSVGNIDRMMARYRHHPGQRDAQSLAIAKPGPDVPAALAEFSGAWIGEWRGERTNAHMGDQLLVFEKVSPTPVTLVSGWIGRFIGKRGDGNNGETRSARNDYPTEIEGDALVTTVARNQNRITYRIQGGRLTARLVMPGGAAWIGTFEKVTR